MTRIFHMVTIHERVQKGQLKWAGDCVAYEPGETIIVYNITEGVDKLSLHWFWPCPAMQEFGGSKISQTSV